MICSTEDSRSPIEEPRKRGRSNDEDHISKLPESIISHILSCLPTKDAVRTCVLSKDWEYKWTSIYNIDINDRVLFSSRRNNKATFVDFVERIFLLSQNLKKVRLFCRGKYNLRRVTRWITAALRRNVESFELKYYQAGIVLPRSLLNNSSLRNLNIELPCTFKVPFKNCFPNLTSLYLDGVEIRNELSNNDTLIFTFPVLETLKLINCKWLNVKFVEIYAPALSTFTSKTRGDTTLNATYSIKIFGLRLVKFDSYGGLPENFILNGPPVVKADLLHGGRVDDLQMLRKFGLQFRRLLKEFSSLEEWELTAWVTETIAQSKQGLALPRYDKLRELFLAHGANIGALLELLHSAPSLKLLMVETDELDDYDYDVVESVPSCVMSHLEEVIFHEYDGKTPEANLAKILFKNAAKLKKCRVNVDINSDISKDEIMEQLSTLPKASTCLSVVVKKE